MPSEISCTKVALKFTIINEKFSVTIPVDFLWCDISPIQALGGTKPTRFSIMIVDDFSYTVAFLPVMPYNSCDKNVFEEV